MAAQVTLPVVCLFLCFTLGCVRQWAETSSRAIAPTDSTPLDSLRIPDEVDRPNPAPLAPPAKESMPSGQRSNRIRRLGSDPAAWFKIATGKDDVPAKVTATENTKPILRISFDASVRRQVEQATSPDSQSPATGIRFAGRESEAPEATSLRFVRQQAERPDAAPVKGVRPAVGNAVGSFSQWKTKEPVEARSDDWVAKRESKAPADEDIKPIDDENVAPSARREPPFKNNDAGQESAVDPGFAERECDVVEASDALHAKWISDETGAAPVRALAQEDNAGEGPDAETRPEEQESETLETTDDDDVKPTDHETAPTSESLQPAQQQGHADGRSAAEPQLDEQESETPETTDDEDVRPTDDETAPTSEGSQPAEQQGDAGEGSPAESQLEEQESEKPEATDDEGAKPTDDETAPDSSNPEQSDKEDATDEGPVDPEEIAPDDPEVRSAISEFVKKPIGAVTTDISPSRGVLPSQMAGRIPFPGEESPTGPISSRGWGDYLYQWEAPAFCHRPLYFEQINLERHGYSLSRFRLGQSALSGAHFFGNVLALPYRMTAEPPGECTFTLGHYRPGSCVPYQMHWPEWKPSAAAMEAGVIAGLIIALP